FFQNVAPGDSGAGDIALKLVFVTFVDFQNGSARFVGAIRKDETRRLPRLEPDLEFQPRWLFVRDNAHGEKRFDRLRVMDVPLCHIAGDNADTEGFGKIDPED